jgi:hypothetical protein
VSPGEFSAGSLLSIDAPVNSSVATNASVAIRVALVSAARHTTMAAMKIDVARENRPM